MRPILSLGVVLGLGLMWILNAATLRKKEDPVLKTQTDPILYEQKMQEVEEGLKEAPTPSYKWYWKNEFLTEPPYVADNEGEAPAPADPIPDLGDPIPEDLSGLEAPPAEEEDWGTDWWSEI